MSESDKLLKKWIDRQYEHAKRRFDAGDRGAILEAIFLHTYWGKLPGWAIEAFQNAYDEARFERKHASWDDVFGKPHGLPKNAKRFAAKRSDLPALVWLTVKERRAANAARRQRRDVFPGVADDFHISVGLAKDLFYEAEEIVKAHPWKADQWREEATRGV